MIFGPPHIGNMLALLMILAATFGATLTTYTFEKTFPLTTRLAVGAALGQTFSTLVGFTAAMVFGAGLFSVGVTAAVWRRVLCCFSRDAESGRTSSATATLLGTGSASG